MLLWLSMDILRKAMSVGQDIIRRNSLENLSMGAPRVRLVGGGPNCRTWSIPRWFPGPSFPQLVRGRAEVTAGGCQEYLPQYALATRTLGPAVVLTLGAHIQ